jgi:hypothetical protein
MKKLFTLLFIVGILFASKSYAQDDPYWTETWDDTSSTIPTSSGNAPITPTAFTIESSGEWILNGVYRGGSSYSCNGSPRSLRMPKPETVQGSGAVPPGYAITPNLDEGVGKVIFKSGRTGTNRIIGIYKSNDDGTTWELVAKTEKGIGQKCTDTTIVVNDANANRIKFTSEGTGDNDLDDVQITRYKSVGVEEDGMPTSFALNQNYPNPFNPSTTITYSLPKASSVQIKVYDQLGREVATLLNDEMPSGTHSLVWNAAQTSQSLASGVYFVQLRSENFTKSIKVMLLK